MESKKNSFLLILALVVGILIGACTVYFTMVNNKNDDKKDNKVDTVEPKKDNEISTDEVESIGKKLFDKTAARSEGGEGLIFYSSNKLNYENMENDEKIIAAFRISDFQHNENAEICYENLPKECLGYSLPIKSLEKSYHTLFGNNKKITYSDETYIDLKSCVLEEDMFNCYNIATGDEWKGFYDYIKYDHSEIKENNFYVYTKFLSIDMDGKLYSDVERKNKISTLDDELNDKIKTGYFGKIEKQLYSKYEDKAGTYKLTFNKENDNYYWVSTELVK